MVKNKITNKDNIKESNLYRFTLDSIKVIQKAIENNKLIVFVGSGVSSASGISSWHDLIRELAISLGIEDDEFSGDDYFKIPEYYFNERGKKEYCDKVKCILNDQEVGTNSIHRIIFEQLYPQHVITTNYDNLLTKANREYGSNFSIVSNDEQLVGANNSKLIIQMHGNFDNFVLKESDYDSYSNHFKLIETYIKGLFATNVVLFLGFSANDPNIRRIRQWVVDTTGGKYYQPAYLLDVEDNNDKGEVLRIKTEYFKKKGIVRLYYNQTGCENNTKKSNKLENFLNLIVDGTKNSNKKHKDIDYYYKQFKVLDSLNFIDKNTIEPILGIKGIYLMSGRVCRLYTKDIEEMQIKKVLLEYNKSIKVIKYLKKNSLISNIIVKNIKDYNNISNEEKEQIDKLLAELSITYSVEDIDSNQKSKIDYILDFIDRVKKELFPKEFHIDTEIDGIGYHNKLMLFNHNHIEIDRNIDAQKNNVDCLQYAYSLYKQNKIVQSYHELERIALNQAHNPLVSYIIEFNKRYLSQYLFALDDKDDIEVMKKEHSKINLEDFKDKKVPASLKEVINAFSFNSFKSYKETILKIHEDIKKQKYHIEKGGGSFNSNNFNNFLTAYQLWQFTKRNYLFVDNYQDIKDIYRYFIENTLTNYSIEKEKEFMGGVNNKIDSLGFFELHLMIENYSYDELKKLFDRHNIKNIKLNSEDVKSKLLEAFCNLINTAKDKSTRSYSHDSCYRVGNFLLIFALIDLTQEEFSKLFNLMEFISIYRLYSEHGFGCRVVNDFIYSVNNKNKTDIGLILFKDFTLYLLKNYSDFLRRGWIEFNRYGNLLIDCIDILHNTDKEFVFKDEDINYCLYSKNDTSKDTITVYMSTAISIFKLSSLSSKDNIKKMLSDYLVDLNASNHNILFDAVDGGVVVNLTIEWQDKLLEMIYKDIDNKKPNQYIMLAGKEVCISVGYTVANLLSIGKWKQDDKIPQLISKYKQNLHKFSIDKTNIENLIKILEIQTAVDIKEVNLDDLNKDTFRYLLYTRLNDVKKSIKIDNQFRLNFMDKFENILDTKDIELRGILFNLIREFNESYE